MATAAEAYLGHLLSRVLPAKDGGLSGSGRSD
jgi:hypothetical protein